MTRTVLGTAVTATPSYPPWGVANHGPSIGRPAHHACAFAHELRADPAGAAIPLVLCYAAEHLSTLAADASLRKPVEFADPVERLRRYPGREQGRRGTGRRVPGHEVRVAHDGAEGVRTATAWGPDVILCDIGLPGLDGYGVARELRQRPVTSKARPIALTAYSGEDVRQRALETGF